MSPRTLAFVASMVIGLSSAALAVWLQHPMFAWTLGLFAGAINALLNVITDPWWRRHR